MGCGLGAEFYVRSAAVQPGEIPIVIGAGASGFSAVAALAARGSEPIVVSDYRQDRRDLARDAYGASKAFDMVFAEALWSELHGKGVDVIGLILGETDTPALRKLEHQRGTLASEDESPADTVPVSDVVDEAFTNLTNGPTVLVGEQMRGVGQLLASMNRNDAARMMAEMISTVMGAD
jgi:threonine dehydrogenase-like Zn-dependent dehydrogenase